MSRFQGKVVVIAGGATLIGFAVAQAFLKEGARIDIGDLNEAAGQSFAAEREGQVFFRPLDVTDDRSIAGFVDQTAEEAGGIDILVNVACTYKEAGLASTRSQWMDGLNVNVIGPALMVDAVRPYMRKRGGGAIVNFGSVAGKGARADSLIYPASKAAILHMTKCMARALAADNIRANTISPSWTWSNPLIERTDNDQAWAQRAADPLHMLRRFAAPEEVAAGVLFLCSDDASFVTGTDLAVDGGYASMNGDRGLSSGRHLDDYRRA